jgi:DNA-binding MarR family transcriptional regulator
MTRKIDLAACATQCRCLEARREARAISRLYDEQMRPHGLRATQFSVLVALELGGGSPLGMLADTLGLDRTTFTRSAALMRRKGWIASAQSDDGREHRMTLTAAGRRKLHEAHPAWQRAQRLVEQRGSIPKTTRISFPNA